LKTRIAISLIAISALAGLAACGGSRWVVIQQGGADKFANKPAFTVLPVDYSNLQINGQPEAAALAAMDDANRKDWSEIKVSFADAFQSSLLEKGKGAGLIVTTGTPAAAGSLVLKPTCGSMVPGHWAAFGRSPSTTVVTLEVSTASGELVDKVQFTNSTPGGAIFPSSKIRIQRDGFSIGEYVSSYLASRSK
jgi:hypothetical protein